MLFRSETLRDLKASNAEQRYMSGLSDKIRAVEPSIAILCGLFMASAIMYIVSYGIVGNVVH